MAPSEAVPTRREIRATLRARGDPEIAAHAQRFFKTGPGEYGEGDRFLGIRVPVLRALAKQYRALSVEKTFRLLTDREHETRLLALIMLVHHYRKGDDDVRARIYRGYLEHTAYVNGWDLVDSSAEHIVGAQLLTRSRRPLYRLARSKRLWERRIAIMSTFHFIRHNDFDETLALCERLRDDPHDLIHKATGWMLREVGNRDRAPLEAFLAKHAALMPRTMLRYTIEKLPQADRKRWMRARS